MLGTICKPRVRSVHGTFLRMVSKKVNKQVKHRKQEQEKEDCRRAAILLTGCGYLDGTSVHEASAVAVTLTRNGVLPVFFAPKLSQTCVIDHFKICPVCETRCALTESARIARQKVQPLCDLRHCDVSCLVVPGGFGVAQTLSTFQSEKENCTIDGEVMRVMEEFHDVKKPMGFICIAAILPAKMFPCVKITLGMKENEEKWPYRSAIEVASEMGAEVEHRRVDEFSFDKQHMVFTTPAFMYNGYYHEIFDGIARMIENMCLYLE